MSRCTDLGLVTIDESPEYWLLYKDLSQLIQIRDWIKQRNISVVMNLEKYGNNHYMKVKFRNKKEEMMFKLTWL